MHEVHEFEVLEAQDLHLSIHLGVWVLLHALVACSAWCVCFCLTPMHVARNSWSDTGGVKGPTVRKRVKGGV